DRKRIVDADHEHAAHHIDDADRDAAGCSRQVAAIAGHARREVGGTEQPRLGANVIDRLLAVPNVIAGRHDFDAPIEQLIADLPGDAESGGGVLDVGDDEVDLVVLAQRGQASSNQLATGSPDAV